MKRSKKKFIVRIVNWAINMLASIGIIIVSTKIPEYKVASTILLICGIINSILSFIVLAILIPYGYYLDKSIEKTYKGLRADYYKEIFKKAEHEDNEKVD